MHTMIDRLRAFNMWRDDFLIEASTLLLIIGFIMGTVDIFVTGSVATQQWFKVSWAIVQALAIDGLFFAVWGKVARAEWTRASMKQTIPLAFVGIILAVVAALVNDILTYQQINGIVNSIDAMKQLGISVTAFTHVRAVLVVAVGVLVQLFCRSHGTVEREIAAPSIAIAAQETEIAEEIPNSLAVNFSRMLTEGYVYQLVDPRTNLPFYVGQTTGKLASRLLEHIKDSCNSAKKQVIEELQNEGLLPGIEVLETIPISETWRQQLNEQETYWIEKLRSIGTQLTNVAPPLAKRDDRCGGFLTQKLQDEKRLQILRESSKPSDREILQFLADHPSMKQKEIAAQLQISESRISRLKKPKGGEEIAS